jgi:hypothetical protein
MAKGIPDSQAASEAINRVLAAEQAAAAEIVECRRKALAILREGRARGRAIADRADRRINRVHLLSDAAIERALAEIAAETGKVSETPAITPQLAARLDVAIEELVGEILG